MLFGGFGASKIRDRIRFSLIGSFKLMLLSLYSATWQVSQIRYRYSQSDLGEVWWLIGKASMLFINLVSSLWHVHLDKFYQTFCSQVNYRSLILLSHWNWITFPKNRSCKPISIVIFTLRKFIIATVVTVLHNMIYIYDNINMWQYIY